MAMVHPLSGATDPRWVLAVQAARALEGAVLAPERRQGLLRLGQRMGLTPFDANLVLAIIQDRARRGHLGEWCAAAAAEQLAMVPPPRCRAVGRAHLVQPMRVALWCVGLVAAEAALLWMILS